MVQYPITCILGDRGVGKTLLLTGLAYTYHTVDNVQIIANYHLKHLPYKYMTAEQIAEIASDPDDTSFNDAIICLDEGHMGADAYEVFHKRTKGITTLTTQLRKKRIHLFYTTQRFNTIAKRLRQMTDYTIEPQRTDKEGVIFCRVFDLSKPQGADFLREFMLDGRKFFDYYDTNEIITN